MPPLPYAPDADVDFLINAFWEGAKFMGRYIFPVEDAMTLVDGNDWEGVEQKRVKTAGFILVGLIPGGKLSKAFKPVTKLAKGTYRSAKVILKNGTKTVVRNFDDLVGIAQWLNRLKANARYVTAGTGPYDLVGVHHPLSKIAFDGDAFYDLKKAFSVSTTTLESYGGKGFIIS